MDALNAIFTRRSIRAFRPDPVDPDAIRTVLDGAMHAASAGNQQPWRFVVLQDRATLQAIAQEHPYAAVLEQGARGDPGLRRHPGACPPGFLGR